MSEPLAILGNTLPAATSEAIGRIMDLEAQVMTMPQLHFVTEHLLHAGMYARTVRLAPGTLIVGVLVKIPTVLVVHGQAKVYAGEQWYDIEDYQVIPASAGRKQIFVAISSIEITMLFPTNASSVAAAEAEFTDELDKLISRRDGDDDLIVITGVPACRE